MKNVILLLQLVTMVQSRGVDPTYLIIKSTDRDSGLKEATQSESVTVDQENEFSFITKFLSSENSISDSFLKNTPSIGASSPGSENSQHSQKNAIEDTYNKMSLDTFMSIFIKTQTTTKTDQEPNQNKEVLKDKFTEEGKLASPPGNQKNSDEGRRTIDSLQFGNEDYSQTKSREDAPLTPAQDRQLLVTFNPVDINEVFVEARYQNLVQELPSLIDEAREVIIQDIVTKNMLGYTIAGSFIIGAFLDTVGLTLLEIDSFGQVILNLITDKFWPGVYIFFWVYAFGYGGRWYFADIFNGGDPNLKCSSADYFQLLNDHDLTLNIQSFTQLSPAESVILVERVSRDFQSRLGCIVNKKSEYKEALLVTQAFQSLIFLTSLPGQLSASPPPDPTPRDLSLLDSELLDIWAEIILLTDQVYDEVLSRRAHEAVVYVFLGFLNVVGMVGGFIFYGNIGKEELSQNQQPLGDSEQHIQDVILWVLGDGVDSQFIRSVGKAMFSVAPAAWGYGYWMKYFLFLESAEPGCGPSDREDVYAKYTQLGSLADLLDTGISIVAVTYFLEEWRREMRAGLYCLLNTEEGGILADTINMYYNLATTRLYYTRIGQL